MSLLTAASPPLARAGPAQEAMPGSSMCTQYFCYEYADVIAEPYCSETGLVFECMTSVSASTDISFLGHTMQCDNVYSDKSSYYQCTCIIAPKYCDTNGALSDAGDPSIAGETGYASSTTIIGRTTPTSGSSGGGSSHSGAAGISKCGQTWAVTAFGVLLLHVVASAFLH